MYIATTTYMHMDYTLPLKQGTSFQMLCKHGMCVCGLFVQSMQLHTHKNAETRSILEILILTSLYLRHMLTQ